MSGSFWNCTHVSTVGAAPITSRMIGAICGAPAKKYARGWIRSTQCWTSFALSRRSSGAAMIPVRQQA